MKIDEIYPSKYLRGCDLAGHAVPVTIENVLLESFYDSESKETVKKPVVYFQGKQKGVVLGKALAFQFAEVLKSHNTDDWKGMQVMIFSIKRVIFGQEKEILQVKSLG